MQTILFTYFENYQSTLKIDEVTALTATFKNEFTQTTFEKYMDLVPKEMGESVLRYRKWEDRYNSLFGKLLVFLGYYILTGEKINFQNLKVGPFGKPFMAGSDLNFNISHSYNTVVCVFSRNDIGVDIEHLKEVNFDFYKDSFTKIEMDEFYKKGIIKFYEYWTKKEAISKALGQGFSIPFDEIKINEKTNEYNGKNFWIYDYFLDNKYCSIAADMCINKIEWVKVEF